MVNIQFIKDENKATAYDDNILVGECDFVVEENIWNIVHTGVDEGYQGQGIARRLVECVIENAKKNNKGLIANCSYAQKILNEKS